MGIPSPSSHSPGPKGIVTGPAELVNPCAPAEPGSMPLFRSLHSVIVSSITIFVSSSREMSTCRRRRTHSLSRRIHVQGSDQSSRITTNVSGTDWAVKSGLRRGAKDKEGSESRYAETRAKVSLTFILAAISKVQGTVKVFNLDHIYLLGQHPEHPGMCILKRTDWRLGVLFPSACRLTSWDLTCPQIVYLETLFGSRECLLKDR
jgi:hypothetical protein